MVPKYAAWCAGAAMVAALALTGCGLGYYAQAASGQFAVMRARQPIAKLIEAPDTDASLKTQLLRARQIRDFATRELALPDNAAYRSYADIHRRYVVWNVVAAPEFDIEPRQWCFPIVGCVAYRGYFSEQSARDFAAGLAQAGDDVLVGGVPAYSTLGRIADPLLSTVTSYAELDLAALIFHELAHQVVYLPGDSSFNEAFATAVEEEGVARYAAAHADGATLAAWQASRRMRVAVTALIIQTRKDLGVLYALPLSLDEMRGRKAERITRLGEDIRTLERVQGQPSGYANWINAGFNNARLASVATYYDRVPHFETLLHSQCGGSLPCLYARAGAEATARPAVRSELPRSVPGPRRELFWP